MMMRSFLLWTTGIILLVIVVFALPLVATGILLAITMLLSPAVWISVASYASGGTQAFFRGGLVCGILPFGIASTILIVLASQLAASGEVQGFVITVYSADPVRRSSMAAADSAVATGFKEHLPLRLTLAGIWLTPGVIAFLGGGLSYLTFRMVTPNQTHLGSLACNAPNATFKRHAGDESGSALSEDNVERVASERG